MAERTVYMTSFDMERLESLIQTHRSSSPKRKARIDRLEKELDRAVIVDPKDIPADVVTMNTKLRLRDETSGEEMVLSLVFPADADLDEEPDLRARPDRARRSWAIGWATSIEWEVPSGTKTFRITETLYQPEASGHYDV